jgi:DNA polymerase-3 subunit epsilon
MTAPHDHRDPELAACADRLRASEDYRVLERLRPRPVMGEANGEAEGRGLVIDVETTGRNSDDDLIIQMAAIPFRYTKHTGRITAVDDAVVQFDDPGRPIPAEVQELTGITDENVRGERLDETLFTRLAEDADVVIAHNARFDRPFVERRLPAYRDCAWACTWAEIPWGPGSQTLEMLLARKCGLFADAHRADEDCLAVIELLAVELDGEHTAMWHLLQAARRDSVRVRAVGAIFEVKDQLKDRGYRWWPGGAGVDKCWYREIPVEQRDDEATWLAENAYVQGRFKAQFDPITPRTRYRPLGA